MLSLIIGEDERITDFLQGHRDWVFVPSDVRQRKVVRRTAESKRDRISAICKVKRSIPLKLTRQNLANSQTRRQEKSCFRWGTLDFVPTKKIVPLPSRTFAPTKLQTFALTINSYRERRIQPTRLPSSIPLRATLRVPTTFTKLRILYDTTLPIVFSPP